MSSYVARPHAPSRADLSRPDVSRGALTRAAVAGIASLALLAGCGEASAPYAGREPSPEPTPTTSPTTSPAPSPEPSPEPTPEPAGSDAPGRGTVITTSGSDYGTMLFDATGQAIYLFDKEATSTPRCYGPCADAWPPVLTSGAPRARGETQADLLGTVRRRDGSTQVTYAGHPLYFYAHEGKHQVLCHDVDEFGGLWLVVTPGGDPADA